MHYPNVDGIQDMAIMSYWRPSWILQNAQGWQSVTRLVYDQDTLEMQNMQKHCVKTSEQGYLVSRPTKSIARPLFHCYRGCESILEGVEISMEGRNSYPVFAQDFNLVHGSAFAHSTDCGCPTLHSRFLWQNKSGLPGLNLDNMWTDPASGT
jgi:hypothetical protein